MAEILFIDMWPDELPSGILRERYKDLPSCTLAHGHRLMPRHHHQLSSVPMAALQAVIISGSRTNLVDDPSEDALDGRPLSAFAGVIDFIAALPPSTPVLGICFGHQFLAKAAGGRLQRMPSEREEHDFPLQELEEDELLKGLGSPPRFVESHGWTVVEPGAGYRVVARSGDGIEMVRHHQLPRVGVQFHPEYFGRQRVPVDRQPDGRIFLDNWLRRL